MTIDSAVLDRLDALVARGRFPNRSQAIESALADSLARIARTRLAEESAKLDVREEQALADEGLTGGAATWPEY